MVKERKRETVRERKYGLRGCEDVDEAPLAIVPFIATHHFRRRIAHLVFLGILTLDSSSAFCDGLNVDPSMSRGKGKLPEYR
ncbi:hypothetical protein Sjap_000786 [Stephania japonica]|uniref:Uncharacterized protein n=1 Tax=Stephania japonica TaxID=461633 RepID=A0AAP0KIS2_9MAGN